MWIMPHEQTLVLARLVDIGFDYQKLISSKLSNSISDFSRKSAAKIMKQYRNAQKTLQWLIDLDNFEPGEWQ